MGENDILLDETLLEDEVITEENPVDVDPNDDEIASENYPDTVYIDANNVMLMSEQPESYAIGSNNGYQLPEYYVNYFRGVVDNLGDTEYIAFAYRDYTTSSGYQQYTEHYMLIYDIEVNNDVAVTGTYPCIDIYRDSGNSYYVYTESTYSLSSYPSFSYGSFGRLSSIGKGDTYEANMAVTFGLAVAFVCFLLGMLFRKRSRN